MISSYFSRDKRVRALHKAEGRNAMPREAMARHLGFGTINGSSATLISALAKYGLIDAAGDGEARVSDLAMRIMHPHDDDEREAALEEAAFRPALFREIKDKWPERAPSDESLRPYLVRKGFAEGALDQVIRFYRETIDIVPAKQVVHDRPSKETSKENVMQSDTAHSSAADGAPPKPTPPSGGKPFTIAFDGSVLTGSLALRSTRDIDRLMRVLSAQKAAFEAMEEDEDDLGSAPRGRRV
jgi:hypothetical protein